MNITAPTSKRSFSFTNLLSTAEGVSIGHQSEEKQTGSAHKAFADILSGKDAKQASASGLSGKALSEEEQKRLEKLQDQLEGIVLNMGNNPTKEDVRKAREIENEIAKLTGQKTNHALSEGLYKLYQANKTFNKDDRETPEKGMFAQDISIKKKTYQFHLSQHVQNENKNTPKLLQQQAIDAYTRQGNFS
ncbi:hypothetical protein LWC08_03095 [Desulfobaculum bizertense]|uniref:hypothetical protein n=1 Tax=Desulfobaculum bizertense TaxID=376490 RepID=UPI001F3ABD7E|nr:hypothetical protein [Desulfobaculum bizertense]UIJ38570.1 hypothetical protein LWC08_03095 [Desulfobaculum bizertense]